jgi:hypothetical protein
MIDNNNDNDNDNIIIIENIIDYKFKFSTRDLIIYFNQEEKEEKENEKQYYFIVDSNASRDFGYWIFENFIFISILTNLNKSNPNIKILSKITNYDIKNLLKFFNINNEIVNKIDNPNNICYLPKIYSMYYIHRLDNDIYYNYYLINYINYIKSNIDNTVNKYDYVFINMNNNNDEIITKIRINTSINNAIFIDDNNENIKYNLSIINNAKIIILLYDPSFFYNCIFLENKLILIIEDYIYRPNGIGTHLGSNPFLNYLFKTIYTKNKILIIKLADLCKSFI